MRSNQISSRGTLQRCQVPREPEPVCNLVDDLMPPDTETWHNIFMLARDLSCDKRLNYTGGSQYNLDLNMWTYGPDARTER